jgi:signal transduction histidine kinase
MLLKTLLLFMVGGLNALIGLIVLLRDPQKTQNRLFFVFSLSLAGWVICIGGFLLSNDPSIAYTWARLYYAFPLLVAASMPLFARAFPDNEKIPRSWWMPIVGGFFALSIPIWIEPQLLMQELVYWDWGKEIVLNQFVYLLYSIYLVGCFVVGLAYTYLKSKRNKGMLGLQSYFFFIGFLLTSFFGVAFNLILPWLGNYRLIWLGPLFTNAFILATGYSIIRHRMFDVRSFIARSVAYLISLSVLASVYGFLIFGTATILFDVKLSLSVQIILSLTTAIAAMLFSGLKSFFDKITNRLFYRDAYDSQLLLDKLNRLLVDNTNLEQLVTRSAELIKDNLKAEFCFIGIRDAQHDSLRTIGAGTHRLSKTEVIHIEQLSTEIPGKILITDELDARNQDLAVDLQKHSIAVWGRLSSTAQSKNEGLGYLAMGQRRSGNPYTPRDHRTLEIIVNELVIAIENSLHFEQIQNFNTTLKQKVDDATSQLKRSNKKLQQLDATKDEFISMASHQLRTPLTSVKGYLSMVLDGDAGSITKDQRRFLTQAYVSSQRMVYTIADLLNVSRLQTGKFIIERSPVTITQIVEEEIEPLRETAKLKNITLTYEASAFCPPLMLDETKTRQVIMNFIDNAIYYTPNNGHINVAIEATAKMLELRVTDDGIGVPKADQPHMFTKFYRASNAQKVRPDGTGLGLFMAKKVIIAQGGSLLFKSTHGKGSTFGFSFPLVHE